MLSRRDFLHKSGLRAAAALGAVEAIDVAWPRTAAVGAPDRLQIIDCHTHFYDPTRPEDVPWPKEGSTELRRLKSFADPTRGEPARGTFVLEKPLHTYIDSICFAKRPAITLRRKLSFGVSSPRSMVNCRFKSVIRPICSCCETSTSRSLIRAS